MLFILEVVEMIELRILNEELHMDNLYIDNINHILVSNHHNLYTFLNTFFTNDSAIFLGNRKIDNKTSYIINLLDYESISNQLELKKGTLLYDYLMEEICENVENFGIEEELEVILFNLVNKTIENKTIEYDIHFDIDIMKVITNYIQFKIDLSIENYIKIIKKIIINLKNKNMKKSILIFVNSHIFGNSLDNLENITIFKFYDTAFPNIYIGSKIVNIDQELLLNQLRINWPCEISDNLLRTYIQSFVLDITNQIITTENYQKYVAYILISKALQIQINCHLEIVSLDSIPDSYIKFINSL